jgi:hypothetical protein
VAAPEKSRREDGVDITTHLKQARAFLGRVIPCVEGAQSPLAPLCTEKKGVSRNHRGFRALKKGFVGELRNL